MQLPGIEFDGDFIGDSTTALSYPSVPQTLVVIGGGYIGLELGSVWSRLGSKVIVLEGMDHILPGLDQEIAKMARRIFEKQGLEFHTGMWVEQRKRAGRGCEVKCKDTPVDRMRTGVGVRRPRAQHQRDRTGNRRRQN